MVFLTSPYDEKPDPFPQYDEKLAAHTSLLSTYQDNTHPKDSMRPIKAVFCIVAAFLSVTCFTGLVYLAFDSLASLGVSASSIEGKPLGLGLHHHGIMRHGDSGPVNTLPTTLITSKKSATTLEPNHKASSNLPDPTATTSEKVVYPSGVRTVVANPSIPMPTLLPVEWWEIIKEGMVPVARSLVPRASSVPRGLSAPEPLLKDSDEVADQMKDQDTEKSVSINEQDIQKDEVLAKLAAQEDRLPTPLDIWASTPHPEKRDDRGPEMLMALIEQMIGDVSLPRRVSIVKTYERKREVVKDEPPAHRQLYSYLETIAYWIYEMKDIHKYAAEHPDEIKIPAFRVENYDCDYFDMGCGDLPGGCNKCHYFPEPDTL